MEKTLQQQYDLIKEGKGNKDYFLKSARRIFPEFVTPVTDYNTAIHILKTKSILSEEVKQTQKTDWVKVFKQNIKEVVGVKDKEEYGDQNTFKASKETIETLKKANFDNSNPDNIDNVYGQSFLLGFLAEMDDPKNKTKTVDEVKKIVAKNMAKDINYYSKNAMFSVKGIKGEQLPAPKDPKGKHKSSGYGNLNESKITLSGTDKSIKMLKSELKNNGVNFETEGNKVIVDDSAKVKMAIKMVKERLGMQSIKSLKENKPEVKKSYNQEINLKNIGEFIEQLIASGKDDITSNKILAKKLNITKSKANKILDMASDVLPSYTKNVKKEYEEIVKQVLGNEPLNESKLRSLIQNIIKEELE